MFTVDGEVIDTRGYDTAGRLANSIYANGVSTAFDYRADGLVSQIATVNPGTQKVGTYDYAWDATKNKTAELISGAGIMDDFGFNTPASGYDAEDRLTAWNRSDGNRDHSWNLSPVGDWGTFAENGTMTPFSHNASHELQSVGSQTVTYDGNGNRLTSSSGNEVYTWDADNRLASVTGTVNHAFEYDALGRRVAISAGGATQILVCKNQQLIAVYDHGSAAQSPAKTFVYGSYIDEPLMMQSGSDRYFFSRNQQYSITALTNASGSVVERYAYDAYGETLTLSPSGTPRTNLAVCNPFTYTGRYQHSEVGLMYFRARYYDPSTGEFISRDPLEYVDGMSLYRGYFVPGAVDPFGLFDSPGCALVLPAGGALSLRAIAALIAARAAAGAIAGPLAAAILAGLAIRGAYCYLQYRRCLAAAPTAVRAAGCVGLDRATNGIICRARGQRPGRLGAAWNAANRACHENAYRTACGGLFIQCVLSLNPFRGFGSPPACSTCVTNANAVCLRNVACNLNENPPLV